MLETISTVIDQLEKWLAFIFGKLNEMGVFDLLKWVIVIILSVAILYLVIRVLSEFLKEATQFIKKAIRWFGILLLAAILFIIIRYITDENRTCLFQYEMEIWQCQQ